MSEFNFFLFVYQLPW